MNVFLYYDSISRASVVFPLAVAHGLCGFPWTRCLLTRGKAFPTGGHVWMTPWYAGGAKTQEIKSE